jgi:hypothetical protein
MSDKKPKKTLVGPWRTLHIVIWLVGLYILLSRGWIFPGIFLLIAISAIYEGLLARYAPHAYEEEAPSATQPTSEAAPATTTPEATPNAASPSSAPAVQEHRLDLLPQICPSCNGPIRGYEVKWTGPQSADCPYCGTNLPMKKS